MTLLGPGGQPISSAQFRKGATKPKLGEAYGNWGGRDLQYMTLPGGGVVQFDLNKLTVQDFRGMRDNYQVNASLSVLSFLLHQSDWHIESKEKRVAEACEENLREVWTQLNRTLSQANWAGYSPAVLQFENDSNNNTVNLTKIKDLIPEECSVSWKKVDGWAPPGHIKPKFNIFDGIKQFGARWPIPVSNSFWFALLQENGDHYGRKLLRSAFQPYFFGILLHLFANRYYERFGEPVPVGRAPFDESLDINGTAMNGNTYMLSVLSQLRNRSAVVLPNDKTEFGDGKSDYDYSLSYLEGQMRGADFERYMTRLDEEISLGIFTPILLMRTSDVGSYNLGTNHMQLFLWMLNCLNDDRAMYINKYILRRIIDLKFGESAPDAKIVFRKMGSKNEETIRAVVTSLVGSGKVKPDLKELGEMAGMQLIEVEETIQPDPDPAADSADDGASDNGGSDAPPPKADTREARIRDKKTVKKVVANSVALSEVVSDITARVEPQIVNMYRDGKFSDVNISMGFKKKFTNAFTHGGFAFAEQFYAGMDSWFADVLPAASEISSAERFMEIFNATLSARITEAVEDEAAN